MSDSTATPSSEPTGAIHPAFARIIDDAALFPPGNAPLDEAVTAFLSRRAEAYADLVGSFVISDHRLADLRGLVPEGAEPIPVSVVIGAGAGGLAPAASTAQRLDEVTLSGLEVALRDPDDLVSNARRVIAALDQALDAGLVDDEVPIFVELPQMSPSAGWLNAVDELAARELPLKFRTGGVDADLFPTTGELAAWIIAALDREVPFKCTAGLHRAVRHSGDDGFEHHGFLNVLMATRVSLDGADSRTVELVLAERDGTRIADDIRDRVGLEALARTRRWFTGFGCCDVDEPHEDLVDLGLLGAGTGGP